jgi:hypothetical protein
MSTQPTHSEITSDAAQFIQNDLRYSGRLSEKSGTVVNDDLSVGDWIELVIESRGQLALQFLSAEGAHYVTMSKGELVAVYCGPHGAENRPTSIREEAVEQLINETPTKLVRTENASITDTIVAPLL